MMLKIFIPSLSIWMQFFIWKFLMTKVQCSTSTDKISDVANRIEPLIINGYYCPIEEHPYMISIRLTRNFRHFCGGSLISEFWILTAAHCCGDRYKYGTYSAYAGLSVTNRRVLQKQLIARTHKHPDYGPHNDIGLMELAYPISQTHSVRYVHLASRLHPQEPIEEICNECIVAGWGDQFVKDKDGKPVSTPTPPYNPHLQCVNLTAISNTLCKKIYRRLPETCMCTYVEDKDACQGDSGGPLLCNEVQYGLVAFGIGCAYKDYPGAYTRVDKYEDFIRDTILRGGNFSVYKCANFFYIFIVLNSCVIL